MKVNIGLLKNDLSKYLHQVRDGQEITVTDRNEPVARIIPLEKKLVQVKIKEWLKKHPTIRTSKKQPPSLELLRKIREER